MVTSSSPRGVTPFIHGKSPCRRGEWRGGSDDDDDDDDDDEEEAAAPTSPLVDDGLETGQEGTLFLRQPTREVQRRTQSEVEDPEHLGKRWGGDRIKNR